MQKPKCGLWFVAIMIAFCGAVSTSAQQAKSTEKQALVSEFRKLTGADKVNTSINFSLDGIKESLSAMVEGDKELTDKQKQELRKSAAEAAAGIAKVADDFFANKSEITQLSEEVIYQIYDKAFTETELKEVIAFYRTPAGQKAVVFLPSLSSQVQKEFGEVIRVKLEKVIQPKIQRETEQLKQKIADVKARKGEN